jgi:hypothetical protein
MLARVGSGRRLVRKALRRPMRLPMTGTTRATWRERSRASLLMRRTSACTSSGSSASKGSSCGCSSPLRRLPVGLCSKAPLRRRSERSVLKLYAGKRDRSPRPGMGDFGRFDVLALDEPDRYARFGESLPVRRAAPEIALNRRHHRRTGACKHQHGNCDVVSLLATPIADSASSAPSAPSASTGY